MKRTAAILSLVVLWRHDKRHREPPPPPKPFAPIWGFQLWLAGLMLCPLLAMVTAVEAESLTARLTDDDAALAIVPLAAGVLTLAIGIWFMIRVSRWWRRRYR